MKPSVTPDGQAHYAGCKACERVSYIERAMEAGVGRKEVWDAAVDYYRRRMAYCRKVANTRYLLPCENRIDHGYLEYRPPASNPVPWIPGTAQCPLCKQDKPQDEFASPDGIDGADRMCADCRRDVAAMLAD
jgi:hypothetical protein